MSNITFQYWTQCFHKRCLLAFTDNQALERNCSFEVTAMAITNSSKYCYILVTSMQHLSPGFPHLLFLWFTARDMPSSAFHLVRMEIYTFVATCPSTLTSSDDLTKLNINTSQQLEPTNQFTSQNILIHASYVFFLHEVCHC